MTEKTKKILLVAVLAIMFLWKFDYLNFSPKSADITWDVRAIAANSLAVAILTETINPAVKVPRSKCEACKGTGKVKSGDGLSWSNCEACYDDGDEEEDDDGSAVSPTIPEPTPDPISIDEPANVEEIVVCTCDTRDGEGCTCLDGWCECKLCKTHNPEPPKLDLSALLLPSTRTIEFSQAVHIGGSTCKCESKNECICVEKCECENCKIKFNKHGIKQVNNNEIKMGYGINVSCRCNELKQACICDQSGGRFTCICSECTKHHGGIK